MDFTLTQYRRDSKKFTVARMLRDHQVYTCSLQEATEAKSKERLAPI